MVLHVSTIWFSLKVTYCSLIFLFDDIESKKFQVSFSACSEGLGEGYDGDIAFASALETFGGGHNDPISVAFGGINACSKFSPFAT